MNDVAAATLASVVETAVQAAREAGEIQRARGASHIEVIAKGEADITTDVDTACEAAVARVVRKRFPLHAILGEEGTADGGDSSWLWIIDPLDGTKNFAHGYPRSAVSIAWSHQGVVLVGVVYNARADELFVAVQSRGATCNGAAIHVSRTETIGRAMVASALTYAGREADRVQMERLARVMAVAEAVRSDGCAALDLCDVACGRFDAYFEPGLKSWDTAAGALIVREAGGTTSRFDGGAHDPFVPELIASNGAIHAALRGCVRGPASDCEG